MVVRIALAKAAAFAQIEFLLSDGDRCAMWALKRRPPCHVVHEFLPFVGLVQTALFPLFVVHGAGCVVMIDSSVCDND